MLKFKGSYIVNEERDKTIAELDVNEYVQSPERYRVYLYKTVDYLNAEQIKKYIDAAEQLQPSNIVQAGMKKSLVEQLKQKLHDCLLATDLEYRYNHEVSQLKESVRLLEQSLAEERKRRWELESELHELKQSLQESESELENEYGD